MSKKDKKIEIQIVDSKVTVGKDTFDGFTLIQRRTPRLKKLVLQTSLVSLLITNL